MPETGSNIEVAMRIHELGEEAGAARRSRLIGILEAVVLAIVAVATAWSGFQASEWDAVSTKNYALASRYNVLSQEKATIAGQDLLYGQLSLNSWLDAKLAGNEKLAAFFESRFRPAFATAFQAWLRLDPLHNKAAPAGPSFMPQYKNANRDEANRLSALAEQHFETAVRSRENGDTYVRVTVYLATVLFLTALGQRFEYTGARAAVVAIAVLLLLLSTFRILTLPRLL
jgi:hypothetical protein